MINYKVFIAIVTVVVLGGIIFSSFSQKKISRTDFQIVQETETNDFYALFKSAEFMANAIKEMVSSEEFMNKALTVKKDLNNKLPRKRQEKLKAWNEMVYIDDITVHGKFSVFIEGEDEQFLDELASKVAKLIIEDNGLYQGSKDQKKKIIIVKNEAGEITDQYEENDDEAGAYITIRVISGPLIYNSQSLKKALIISLFMLGIGLMAGYLYKIARIV